MDDDSRARALAGGDIRVGHARPTRVPQAPSPDRCVAPEGHGGGLHQQGLPITRARGEVPTFARRVAGPGVNQPCRAGEAGEVRDRTYLCSLPVFCWKLLKSVNVPSPSKSVRVSPPSLFFICVHMRCEYGVVKHWWWLRLFVYSVFCSCVFFISFLSCAVLSHVCAVRG